MRQCSQAMCCGLQRVLYNKIQETRHKVRSGSNEKEHENVFEHATEQGFSAFNIGHHLGWKFDSHWIETDRKY